MTFSYTQTTLPKALRGACPHGSNDWSATDCSEKIPVSPLYTAENCQAAFQLNWSLSLFGTVDFPPHSGWLEALRAATEPDGVRILECQAT